MPKMTRNEAFAFIDALPARTAKLATVRADGSPHVAPIWVALDGEDLVFHTGRDTLKGQALRRDRRVSLCFDDERPPFSFVVVEGSATITDFVEGDDLSESRRWATLIGGRYMGADQAEAYGRRNAVPDELLVRVAVNRIVGVRDVAA